MCFRERQLPCTRILAFHPWFSHPSGCLSGHHAHPQSGSLIMNKQRMLKLADFLDNLPAKKFGFSFFRDDDDDVAYTPPEKCGAVGCAIGWMPTVFPRTCKDWVGSKTKNGYTLKPDDYFIQAAQILDIDSWSCLYLFSPRKCVNNLKPRQLGDRATPKKVADRIRQFVEKYPTSKFTG